MFKILTLNNKPNFTNMVRFGFYFIKLKSKQTFIQQNLDLNSKSIYNIKVKGGIWKYFLIM